ncbi:hypothetical protein [uncultured Methanobrevibacter sp.]|uniref:hypothetical protein n=1 Tax=uncultured Methanobrevibacter sp. TaxID=253161 RepID=UPI0026153E7A|nr:hypothetical protein [uncultured Methanobrevibacter sp.]
MADFDPFTQYRIPRILLEVYKTDEENWEQYTPLSSDDSSNTTTTDNNEAEENTSTDETDDEDSLTKGFKLHQGEIIETYYYGEFTNVEFDGDYEDISNTGSIKIPEIMDLDRFYKGVRLAIRYGPENYGKTWIYLLRTQH